MPRAWFPRLFATIAALLLLTGLMPPSGAHAQVGASGWPLRICLLRDTGGMDAATLIHRPAAFDCTTKQHKLGPGDFWAISGDINQRSRSREPLRVRTSSLWQGQVTLYTLYADGTMRSDTTGAAGVAPLIQLGAIVEQPIARAPAKVVRVMWHISGSANARGVVLGARLSTAVQSERANLTMAALYAGFAGLCFALIVYNLALWVALRHPFQLHYCLMLLGLLVYTFTSSGAFAWAFPAVPNNVRLQTNYLLLGATTAAALVFARSFFEARIFAGWLGRYSQAMAAAMIAAGGLFFVMAPFAFHAVDLLFTTLFMGLVTVVVPTLWRAWRMRSNYLWLFALGWGAPFLSVLLRALANLHLIGWSFWLDNSTLLAMTVEATASAVAIAYRMRLLRIERDDAVASEVMARRLADTDPLTGLLNRRAFLNQAIGRSGRQQLLIADLDHFKRVNETLGHDGGDEVLRLFARVLRSCVPAGGLIARLGGEEFAIVTDTSMPFEAETVLARLRASRMPFDVQVTASIGGCQGFLSSDVDWKRLYRGADAALFEAKSAGRDRVRNGVSIAA